jgi:hypothetical protein
MIDDVAGAIQRAGNRLGSRIELFERSRFLSIPESASKGGSKDLSEAIAQDMASVSPSSPPMRDATDILLVSPPEIGSMDSSFPNRMIDMESTVMEISSGKIRKDRELKRII